MNIEEVKLLCKDIITFYEKEQLTENIDQQDIEKMTNLRLQKILFFLYGFYWKENKKEIIPINFEAWQHGPVIKELYDYVIEKLDSLDKKRYEPLELSWFQSKENLNNLDRKSFKKILNHLSQYSTIRLVNASHDTEPWLKTPNSEIIDNNLIKKWFENDVPEIE